MTNPITPMHEKQIKFCVFCGKKPESKTKEHIIPQWLIKLTGDLNREISLGADTKHFRATGEIKMLKFSFSSFQFPACNSCNNEFSELEVKTKTIVEKVLSNDYLTSLEINTLLDWFDKVRIGLWLGSLLLDLEMAPITPNFHIKKRIAEKDRCLFVYEMKNDGWKGIQFTGFNAPIFKFNPSCFALRINNYQFLNISFDFLFSKNIGFPYPKSQKLLKDSEEIMTVMNEGTQKINFPLLHTKHLTPSIEIYQPIIPKKMMRREDDNEKDIYDNEYVKNNCINFFDGKGSIFFVENKNLIKLDDETEICFSSDKKYEIDKMQKIIAEQVIDQQLYFIKKIPSTEDLTQEQIEFIEEKTEKLLNSQLKFRKLIK